MSHCGTPSFNDHLDHCFVVLKHIQQSFLVQNLDVKGNTNGSPRSLSSLSRVSKNKNNQIPQFEARSPSNLNQASKEIISDPVELCETEVCFLHIQLIGTNV